ncbi:hypothetical protein DGo_PB0346 (plasmid) [Deinococcus gobiensis I-0]|uniref:Uncharacterized protein n=1 Tax=Deinococcus gobiensis (strain DSM 21396 / JCM 16679 / CGMCC 1.7299 / I-0) TaxID=745776 RepID=H8H268_DEIGI|nr:hypothetical protein DGo_PB0346 [Deinococcus gobiensis I-0]
MGRVIPITNLKPEQVQKQKTVGVARKIDERPFWHVGSRGAFERIDLPADHLPGSGGPSGGWTTLRGASCAAPVRMPRLSGPSGLKGSL